MVPILMSTAGRTTQNAVASLEEFATHLSIFDDAINLLERNQLKDEKEDEEGERQNNANSQSKGEQVKGPLPPSVLLGSNSRKTDDVTGQIKVKRKCGRPRNPIPRHKRESHINAEHRRRGKIQDGFRTLKNMVPKYEQASGRDSKADILFKAVDHCTVLQRDIQELTTRMDALKAEKEALNLDVKSYQAVMPDISVYNELIATLDDRYEDYVQTRIKDNPKFWIFSYIMQPLFESFKAVVSGQSTADFMQTVSDWSTSCLTVSNLRAGYLAAMKYISCSSSRDNSLHGSCDIVQELSQGIDDKVKQASPDGVLSNDDSGSHFVGLYGGGSVYPAVTSTTDSLPHDYSNNHAQHQQSPIPHNSNVSAINVSSTVNNNSPNEVRYFLEAGPQQQHQHHPRQNHVLENGFTNYDYDIWSRDAHAQYAHHPSQFPISPQRLPAHNHFHDSNKSVYYLNDSSRVYGDHVSVSSLQPQHGSRPVIGEDFRFKRLRSPESHPSLSSLSNHVLGQDVQRPKPSSRSSSESESPMMNVATFAKEDAEFLAGQVDCPELSPSTDPGLSPQSLTGSTGNAPFGTRTNLLSPELKTYFSTSTDSTLIQCSYERPFHYADSQISRLYLPKIEEAHLNVSTNSSNNASSPLSASLPSYNDTFGPKEPRKLRDLVAQFDSSLDSVKTTLFHLPMNDAAPFRSHDNSNFSTGEHFSAEKQSNAESSSFLLDLLGTHKPADSASKSTTSSHSNSLVHPQTHDDSCLKDISPTFPMVSSSLEGHHNIGVPPLPLYSENSFYNASTKESINSNSPSYLQSYKCDLLPQTHQEYEQLHSPTALPDLSSRFANNILCDHEKPSQICNDRSSGRPKYSTDNHSFEHDQPSLFVSANTELLKNCGADTRVVDDECLLNANKVLTTTTTERQSLEHLEASDSSSRLETSHTELASTLLHQQNKHSRVAIIRSTSTKHFFGDPNFSSNILSHSHESTKSALPANSERQELLRMSRKSFFDEHFSQGCTTEGSERAKRSCTEEDHIGHDVIFEDLQSLNPRDLETTRVQP